MLSINWFLLSACWAHSPLGFGCLVMRCKHKGVIAGGTPSSSPLGWQGKAPSLPVGPQAGGVRHWPPISSPWLLSVTLFASRKAAPWMQLPALLLAHGHPVSPGLLFLHCCPAKRWEEHQIRTLLSLPTSERAHPHPSSSSSLSVPCQCGAWRPHLPVLQ